MIERTRRGRARGRGTLDTVGACALGVAIGMLSMFGGSSRAQAQAASDTSIGFSVAGTLTIAIPAILFTIADIVSFAENTPFDDGWAVAEIILASVELAGAALLVGVGVASASAGVGSEVLVIVALVPLLFGGLHLGHAIWSLTSPREPSRAGPRPFVAPRADGVIVGLGGVF